MIAVSLFQQGLKPLQGAAREELRLAVLKEKRQRESEFDTSNIFTVQRIVEAKNCDNLATADWKKVEYKVRWKNFTAKDDTWHTAEHLLSTGGAGLRRMILDRFPTHIRFLPPHPSDGDFSGHGADTPGRVGRPPEKKKKARKWKK